MSVTEKRKDQLGQLNEQLAILHSNLTEFDGLVKDVCIQYNSIQELGLMHGSLFMASHMVFGENYNGGNTEAHYYRDYNCALSLIADSSRALAPKAETLKLV